MKVKIWLKEHGARQGRLIGKTTRQEILPYNHKNKDDEFVILKKNSNFIYIPLNTIVGIERCDTQSKVEQLQSKGENKWITQN